MKKIIAFIICVYSLLTAAVFPSVAEGGDNPVFLDVGSDKWYAYAVDGYYWQFDFLWYDHNYDDSKYYNFGPNEPMTREEALAVVLGYVYSDLNSAYKKYPSLRPNGPVFEDVDESAGLYYQVIDFAYKVGLISGVGNNKFGFGQPMKRQDLAVLLYRAMQIPPLNRSTGEPLPEFYYSPDTVKSFTDYSKISSYALPAFEVFCGLNFDRENAISDYHRHQGPLFAGHNGLLRPDGIVTRAELATILYAKHSIHFKTLDIMVEQAGLNN